MALPWGVDAIEDPAGLALPWGHREFSGTISAVETLFGWRTQAVPLVLLAVTVLGALLSIFVGSRRGAVLGVFAAVGALETMGWYGRWLRSLSSLAVGRDLNSGREFDFEIFYRPGIGYLVTLLLSGLLLAANLHMVLPVMIRTSWPWLVLLEPKLEPKSGTPQGDEPP